MISELRGKQLFEAVMTHIEQHPDEHDQRHYGVRVDGRFIGCVAGLTVRLVRGEDALHWYTAPKWMASLYGESAEVADATSVHRVAMALFGISVDEAEQMFSATSDLDRIRAVAADIWA